jgi:hypothetical protein
LSAKTEEEESAAYELISQVITFSSIHCTVSGLSIALCLFLCLFD